MTGPRQHEHPIVTPTGNDPWAPPLPSITEMRADMEDADPGWTGDDALVFEAWCDLFEVDPS